MGWQVWQAELKSLDGKVIHKGPEVLVNVEDQPKDESKPENKQDEEKPNGE